MEYNPQSLLYFLFSLLSEIREIHCIPYLVHFSEDRVIKNSGIMLCHFDTGMTKHFRHVFKAHSLREADRGISMSGNVCSKIFVKFYRL